MIASYSPIPKEKRPHMNQEYQNLSVSEVKEFMRTTKEEHYQLIDVRLEKEYITGHLPGAILIPVGEIEERVAELSVEKDCIFYCHSGKRSVAASVFIGTHPNYHGNIYNMLGGILAWDGHSLPDMPNIKSLGISGSVEELLYQAMNLEKGAHKFYQLVQEHFPIAPFTPVMNILGEAEMLHAKMIYDFWSETQKDPLSFESLYDLLPGDILEGGHQFEALAARLKQVDTQCQGVIEMAMSIEFSAYDLYRQMAHLNKNSPIAKSFLILCQSEKEHMRIAAEAMALC